MTALTKWQKHIDTYRQDREENDEMVWERLAKWYDRWTENNDYVERVLPRLLDLVGPVSRVLEIGPGTGAFTVPLAHVVEEVVAVEPSRNMSATLQHNLDQEGAGNVHIVPGRIEETLDALAGRFDLALASHSLYDVRSIDSVIRQLVHLANSTVILIGTGDRREWYQKLHYQLKGRDRVPPTHFGDFYPVLLDMRIYADVEILPTSYNYVFDDEEAMVEWWAHHFRVKQQDHPILRSTLVRLAEHQQGSLGIYDQNRTAMIAIDRVRNLFGKKLS